MEFLVKVLAAYLLGSVIGSLVLGRLKGVDIRQMGSGNAGATNAIRTQGAAFGIAVFAIDLAKGWLAAAVLPALEIPGMSAAPITAHLAAWLAPACGFAAILGHVFPAWHGFRGGKGVATAAGALLGLHPPTALLALVIWLAVFKLTRTSSIAALVALPLCLPFLAWQQSAALWPMALLACLIVWRHRNNLRDLLAGTERHF